MVDEISPSQDERNLAIKNRSIEAVITLKSTTEEKLKSTYALYESSVFKWQKEMWGISLQAAIFSYESAVAQERIARSSNLFALRIGLKDLAFKIYEFDQMFGKIYFPKVENLSRELGISIARDEILDTRRKLRRELKKIGDFKEIRNIVGAHTSLNMDEYLRIIDSIDPAAVLEASKTIVVFSHSVLCVVDELIARKVETIRLRKG